MVSVFLSHSSKDKPFVRDLADALEAGSEVKVWLDEREIDYGANIVLKIAEGLDADIVLLILSPDSVDSKWVKEEWTDAYWEHVNTQTTKLAGVLYRDCTIPRLLRNKKYFDLRTNQTEGFRQIKTWLLGLRPPVAPLVHLPQRRPLFIGRQPEIEDLQRRLKEGSWTRQWLSIRKKKPSVWSCTIRSVWPAATSTGGYWHGNKGTAKPNERSWSGLSLSLQNSICPAKSKWPRTS
jgi:hypothetical protein